MAWNPVLGAAEADPLVPTLRSMERGAARTAATKNARLAVMAAQRKSPCAFFPVKGTESSESSGAL
jgi:hypothetical protein